MDDNDDDRFELLSTKFLDWLKQNGANISSKIELQDLRHRNAGRGVVAREDIAEDEELFSVSNASILTSDTSSLPPNLKDRLSDPWLSLILAMVYEYQVGIESRWRPYFDVLPTHFDTLMYWSDAELKLLEGSAIVEKIGKPGADRTFIEQILPIVRENGEFFHANGLSDQNLLSLCHRMGSTIMAYAFDLESSAESQKAAEDGWEEDLDEGQALRKGMIPLADMLNADADRNNARLFYEDDRVVMKTIKPVQKGDELFNDYGPLPRADVLRRYGYITDNYAKYDVVEVSLDLVKAATIEEVKRPQEDVDARVQYLEQQDALEDGYDIVHVSSDGEHFPEELIMLLNVLTLSEADFEKLVKKDKLPKADLSREALHLLHAIMLQRKSMYPRNTLGSLSEAAIDSPTANGTAVQAGKRANMAAQVISGELAVLEEAIATVNDQLNDGKKRDRSDAKDQGTSKKQKTEHTS